MGEVVKGKFGEGPPDGCSIECCECGCPLWLCTDPNGDKFGMCPKCGPDNDFDDAG